MEMSTEHVPIKTNAKILGKYCLCPCIHTYLLFGVSFLTERVLSGMNILTTQDGQMNSSVFNHANI